MLLKTILFPLSFFDYFILFSILFLFSTRTVSIGPA